jgi:hypothetical protein
LRFGSLDLICQFSIRRFDRSPGQPLLSEQGIHKLVVKIDIAQ